MTEEIELKYAPRNCEHFCCGDCTLTMKSCFMDKDICEIYKCFNNQDDHVEELNQRLRHNKECK